MRFVMYPVVAAALATAVLSLPAQAATHNANIGHARLGTGSGGLGTGPFWQGEPTDRLPIWRYGYYQGNDPDPFIRGQIMRDPLNGRRR